MKLCLFWPYHTSNAHLKHSHLIYTDKITFTRLSLCWCTLPCKGNEKRMKIMISHVVSANKFYRQALDPLTSGNALASASIFHVLICKRTITRIQNEAFGKRVTESTKWENSNQYWITSSFKRHIRKRKRVYKKGKKIEFWKTLANI